MPRTKPGLSRSRCSGAGYAQSLTGLPCASTESWRGHEQHSVKPQPCLYVRTNRVVVRALLLTFVVIDKSESPQEREAPGETAFDLSRPRTVAVVPNQKGATNPAGNTRQTRVTTSDTSSVGDVTPTYAPRVSPASSSANRACRRTSFNMALSPLARVGERCSLRPMSPTKCGSDSRISLALRPE